MVVPRGKDGDPTALLAEVFPLGLLFAKHMYAGSGQIGGNHRKISIITEKIMENLLTFLKKVDIIFYRMDTKMPGGWQNA